MNFLAHCALADLACEDSDALIAGGVLADFRKGVVPADWPQDLQLGVRLHRRIDAVSNSLDGIRHSCNRFPAPLRRYAPIFVDVHADRSLSRLWTNFHTDDLTEFSMRCYDIVDASAPHTRNLAPQAMRFLGYMRQQDLLANFHKWAHVEQGIQAVCRRLGRQEMAELAVDVLHQIDDALTKDFVDYFPLLVEASSQFVADQLTAER